MATQTVNVQPDLSFTLDEAGAGRPALILHGGGGPFTVASIANHLAGTMHTLTPTHPGWNGTPRPEWLTSLTELARIYLNYLAEQNLRNVLVIGSSIGGWLACEVAVQDEAGLIGGLVLIDAGGIEVAGEPIRDFFALDARGVAEYSYHNPDRFYVDPATVPPQQIAIRQANMETLRVLAGDPYMHNPQLLGRLANLRLPTLVLWGESDRIFTPAYGKAFAAAIPGARFELIKEAGHLPQLEQPAATFAQLDRFTADHY